MYNRPFGFCTVLVLAAAFNGCAGYDITLNDKVIYAPPALFAGFDIKDSALAGCIQQTIEDQSITDPAHLNRLVCTSSGIEGLDGLQVFSELKWLKLSNNNIKSIAALSHTLKLEQLLIDNNQLVSVAPLAILSHLQILDLSNNNALDCKDIRYLQQQNNAIQIKGFASCG